jgi:hypothetical protein
MSSPLPVAQAETGAADPPRAAGPGGALLFLPPARPASLAEGYAELFRRMARERPAPLFRRAEWAYLASFLQPDRLRAMLDAEFGPTLAPGEAVPLARVLRPRRLVAAWLPNNASLLGPLLAILVSLAGCGLRMKAGSGAPNLAGAFRQYALDRLPPGPLRDWWEAVQVEEFGREDPRSAAMAAEADIRVAFGSDAAVAAIEAMPHPATSLGLSFGDHVSEAWVGADALVPVAARALAPVFAAYGRAGCTSPRRVVMLDADGPRIDAFAAALAAAIDGMAQEPPDAHAALQALLAGQVGAGEGWQVHPAPRGAAVVLTEPAAGREAPEAALGWAGLPGMLTLPVVGRSIEAALAELPANIQTIGMSETPDPALVLRLARAGVLRISRLSAMHDFGAVWDGRLVLRSLFDDMTVGI